MASLKKDIEDTLEAALSGHAINEKLDRIASNQNVTNLAIMQILAYLGVEGGGATPEELEALGKRVKGLTDSVNAIDPSQT